MDAGPAPSRFAALGLGRAPRVTLAVAAVTVAVSAAGLLVPDVLAALQRTPAALHGEVWRWLTPLVVQAGRAAGAAPLGRVGGLLWAGALLAGVWAPLLGVGIAGAVLDRLLVHHPARHRAVLVAMTAAAAAVLVAATNVHGAALGAGLLTGGLLTLLGRSAARRA